MAGVDKVKTCCAILISSCLITITCVICIEIAYELFLLWNVEDLKQTHVCLVSNSFHEPLLCIEDGVTNANKIVYLLCSAIAVEIFVLVQGYFTGLTRVVFACAAGFLNISIGMQAIVLITHMGLLSSSVCLVYNTQGYKCLFSGTFYAWRQAYIALFVFLTNSIFVSEINDRYFENEDNEESHSDESDKYQALI